MSGVLRLSLGILGLALMVMGTVGYQWRKRPGCPGPGSMRLWLQIHVASGVVGPLLILLHSGLAFRGMAGVAFWLMMTVVASGLVGRFWFTTVPRAPALDDGAVARLEEETRRLEEAEARRAPGSNMSGGAAAVAMAGVEIRALRTLLQEERTALRDRRAHARRRQVLSVWWIFHVPLTATLVAVALVHALGALYYGVFLR